MAAPARRFPALRLREAGGWLLAALALSPVLALVAVSTGGLLEGHLGPRAFRLVASTVSLGVGTALLAAAWGVSCAWLVESCSFPGRKALGFLLFLPFAVPPYLQAYVWADLVDDGGWLPPGYGLRNPIGACLVMSTVLYPYVYMFARGAFAQRSCGLTAAARVLGCTPWGAFVRTSLPVARPAIAVGCLLVFMEVANDIAIAEDYGLSTLGYHIYDVWLNRDDRSAAAAMAFLLLVAAFVIASAESFSRRRQRQYESLPRCTCADSEYRLRGLRAAAASAWLALVFAVGFAVPAATLALRMAKGPQVRWGSVLEAFGDTLALVASVAATCFLVGGALTLVARGRSSAALRLACRAATVGYAFPGMVYGLGCIALATAAASAATAAFGVSIHWTWTSSTFLLVMALSLRYIVISAGAYDAAARAVPPSYDAACRIAGKTRLESLLQVHLPLMRPVLTVGLMLLAVDVIKELPLTLILRPFGTETLAVRVHQYAADEDLAGAAPAALAMVAMSALMLAPVYRWLVPAWRRNKGDGQ